MDAGLLIACHILTWIGIFFADSSTDRRITASATIVTIMIQTVNFITACETLLTLRTYNQAKTAEYETEYSELDCWLQVEIVVFIANVFGNIIIMGLRNVHRPSIVLTTGITNEKTDFLEAFQKTSKYFRSFFTNLAILLLVKTSEQNNNVSDAITWQLPLIAIQAVFMLMFLFVSFYKSPKFVNKDLWLAVVPKIYFFLFVFTFIVTPLATLFITPL